MRFTGWAASLCAAALLLACSTAQEAAAPPAPAPPAAPATPAFVHNDYANDANWLCRPGRTDACAVDQSASVIAPNGRVTTEAFAANPNAPIDCFYIYPTISFDRTPNSDMVPGPEERGVVNTQFARFTAQCRPFAPMYRQVTLTALNAALIGTPMQADRAMAYQDVVDAWNYYLEHDNNGRGVVIVGHSQGASVLTQLVKNEIDGKPAQARLVSALLIGTNIAVPNGQDVGGAFQHIPACRAATQTGCVIAYVSFRETAPPPANSRFGRIYDMQTMSPVEGQAALCTNPANLSGGAGALHPYFTTAPSLLMNGGRAWQWAAPAPTITTPFVTAPGLISAHCVSDATGSYLAIHVNANPRDARADDIPGDIERNGVVDAAWGLHVIDMQEAMGNLVDLVRQQGAAYVAAHR